MNKTIHNLFSQERSTLGWLMAMDTLYGAGLPARYKRDGVKGGAMAFNYWTGKPEWEGVDGTEEDYAAREAHIVRNHRISQGTLTPSAYRVHEPIDKVMVSALSEDAGIDYVKQLSYLTSDSLLDKLQDDLFPTVNQTGGTQSYANRSSKIMSFAAGLQSGFTDNATTGSGTYNYLGIDLNSRTELKALNVGTESSGWTLSFEALWNDLLRPLRARKAKVDTVLLDSDSYGALKSEVGDTIQQGPADKVNFQGDFFYLGSGVYAVYEPGLDALPAAGLKRELYAGDSGVLRFGMEKDPFNALKLIEDWPGHADSHLLQGFAQFAFVNERPSFWGRGYNVVIA